jgi:voltage-gated potassium channel
MDGGAEVSWIATGMHSEGSVSEMLRIHRHLRLGGRIVLSRLRSLLVQPVFLVLALLDTACVVLAAIGLWLLEHGTNPKIHSLLDTMWWAVATVTTVGYGDVQPITLAGKVLGIFMMVLGTAFFWSFIAFFAGALVSEEIADVELEVKELGKDVLRMEKTIELDEETLHQVIFQLETTLRNLRALTKLDPTRASTESR